VHIQRTVGVTYMQHLLSLTERMLYTAYQLDREISAPRKRKRPREGEEEEGESHTANTVFFTSSFGAYLT